MRPAVLALLLAPCAFAADFDKDKYYADAGVVTDLCRSAMTPPEATAELTKQFEGLCDCAMSGILALHPQKRNAPFLAVWADMARWRLANDPSDRSTAEAIYAMAIHKHYGDTHAGKAELSHYGETAITLTQICSDGFEATGMTAPDFTVHAFYEGFTRKPN